MKETERIIRDLSERHIACRRILEDWNLPECKRRWFEKARDEAGDNLAMLGVDKIVAIRNNGIEREEIVIFEREKNGKP